VTRRGFSLVELVVALTILSLGILVLATAAAFAQRSFAGAEAIDRAARAAALVLDSLTREPAPADGVRHVDGMLVRWSATPDAGLTIIRADVEVSGGGRSHRIVFHASRADVLAR
jgi:prepilin-type N-terminal cleavage/methylation domain-containing protein